MSKNPTKNKKGNDEPKSHRGGEPTLRLSPLGHAEPPLRGSPRATASLLAPTNLREMTFLSVEPKTMQKIPTEVLRRLRGLAFLKKTLAHCNPSKPRQASRKNKSRTSPTRPPASHFAILLRLPWHITSLRKSLILLVLSLHLFSQDDSLKILTYKEFLQQVRKYHPVTLQANLLQKQAKANLRYARGHFDPKILAQGKQKYFQGKQYYSLLDGKLKVPTWYGIELFAGYEQTDGNLLNPENKLPASGLAYAGGSITLGRGLFLDQRRLALKQAKIFLQMNEAQRTLLLNKLLYEASLAYWKWFKAYNKREVYFKAMQRAEERYKAVQTYFSLGNRPAMDTLEAGIQFQSRQTDFLQADLEWKNATAKLNVYLWTEDQTPLEVAENVIPEKFTSTSPLPPTKFPEETLDELVAKHPKINKLQNKTEQLQWERKWKREQLKPVLNLKYNLLTEPVGNSFYNNFSLNNYKWAFTFSYPLFLRKERGGIQLTDVKIQNTRAELQNTRRKIKFLLVSALNSWEASYAQTLVARRTMENSRQLMEAEKTLFEIGESSLFKLNARELKYIKTQVQYIDFLTGTKLAEIEFLFRSARLSE